MLFLAMFLFLINNSNAMQMSDLQQSKIVKILKTERIPLAIAGIAQGNIIILDKWQCTFWDYKNENDEITKRAGIVFDPKRVEITLDKKDKLTHKIYLNPKKTQAMIPSYREDYWILVDGKNQIKRFPGLVKNKSSNILFDGIQGCCLATCKDNDLAFYFKDENYCLKLSISPGLLFKYDDTRFSDTLCCDVDQKTMYMVDDVGYVKKLFDFCTKLDFTHWVYDSEVDRLYAITDTNRELYVADTKTLQQKVLPIADGFKIGTLELLNNKRILVLLSHYRDKICYFDAKNLKKLLITCHETGKVDKRFRASGQRIAVCSNQEDIVISLSHQCLVIKVPLWISWFNAYEKCCITRQMLAIPKELSNLIGLFLCMLDKKQRMSEM